MNNPIDFIVPWVDDSDPEWQTQKANYSPQKANDISSCRYRDMSLLKYLFRGVEKFAPWVNKMHLVTCGHYPKWLNLEHPKLNFVKHIDYMPKEYLPTFNSSAIELNFHRIKELSENFVLFNDDMFLLNKTKPTDFFKNNLPCDQALLSHFIPALNEPFMLRLYNNIAVINKHFIKHSVIKKHLFKWFNFNYKLKSNFINFRNLYSPKFSCILNPHLPIAYKKSNFEYVWQTEYNFLHQTSLNQFRSNEDVTEWLIRYFRIMKGEFKPHKILGKYFELNSSNISQICIDIKKQSHKMICINDGGMELEFFQTAIKDIFLAFETIFPEKCSFEV